MNTPLCRYCNESLNLKEAVETVAYWGATKFFCHPACKEAGERQEAIDCQNVDADCNDCKHFKRGKRVPLNDKILKQIAAGDCPNFTSGAFDGHCLKFDKATSAFPKKWTGRACFEHRRASPVSGTNFNHSPQ